MPTAEWYWVTFKDAKSHEVCRSLLNFVIKDLKKRGSVLETVKKNKFIYLDNPGMICVDRPNETFRFCGLTLQIPSEDVRSMLTQARELKARLAPGGKMYFKLHGGHRCLVLTNTQRKMLIALLDKRQLVAERKAARFYEKNKVPSEMLQEAAAHSSGMPVGQQPDLGGHHLDRFRKESP